MATWDERYSKTVWKYEWVEATNASPPSGPTAYFYDEGPGFEEQWELANILDNLREMRENLPHDEWDNEENN